MLKHVLLLTLTILLLVTSLPRAQPIAVSISDTAVTPGISITLPVEVSDVTGQQISSVLMNLTYSSNVLTAVNVSVNGTIASIFSNNINVNLDIPGRIVVAAAAAENEVLEGVGTLFLIEFGVTGDIGDTTTIHFDEFMFNEGVPLATTEDSFVRIRPSGTGVIVWVRASQDSAYYGQSFWAEIWAENVTDLGEYRFSLGFDPDFVNATSARNGPFLGSTGRAPIETVNVIDNTNGIVTLGYSTEGSSPGPNGGGILGIIEFEVKKKVVSTAESFKLQIESDER